MNVKTAVKIFIIVGLSALLLFGCDILNSLFDPPTDGTGDAIDGDPTDGDPTDGDPTDGDGDSSPMAFMDIADAACLLIAPSGSAAASAMAVGDGETKLFKITDEGVLLEVTYTDDEGNDITNIQAPSAIYNVNATYVIVCFGNWTEAEGYLVRKTDGAVFTLSDVGSPEGGSFYGNPTVVQTDDDGNIYYTKIANSGAVRIVMKLDVGNPEEITGTVYTPDTDSADTFFVDANGNVAYGPRIKLASGGLYNLPEGALYWLGLDGDFRYATSNGVFAVHIDDSYAVTTTEVTSDGFYASAERYLLQLSERTYIIDAADHTISEVENPGNAPRMVSLEGIDSFDFAGGSDSYYYLTTTDASTNPMLIRIDPTDDSVTTLLPDGSVYYIIYAISISSSDDIVFNALRMSDGKKVIGEIDGATGEVTVIDESLSEEIIALERVN